MSNFKKIFPIIIIIIPFYIKQLLSQELKKHL